MQYDRSAYRPGLELTQDCRGGEVTIGIKGAAVEDLITKGASALEIVDDVCIRAGLPTTADLKEAGQCLDAIGEKIREYKSQKFWQRWERDAYL